MSDYIKREDVIKTLEEFDADKWRDFTSPADADALRIVRVNKIPAEDVKPVVHGKWIPDEEGCVCCSECGNPDEFNPISGDFMYHSYCAECGAKMDLESTDNV